MRAIFCIILNCIILFNLYSQKDPYLLKDLKKFKSETLSVTFSPDGKRLLAGLNDGSAMLIDVETEAVLLTLKDHWKGVVEVIMDPLSRYFITAGDNTIKVYTMEGELVHNLKDQTSTIWSVDTDPTGQYIITGAISRIFKLFDVIEGKRIADFSDHTDIVMAACFSPDGRLIASASPGTVKIRDFATKEIILTFPSHPEDIYTIAFSPDGKLLATGSKDKTVRLYDTELKKQVAEYKGHKDLIMDLTFSPDGNYLLSCSFDQTVRLWEISTGKTLYTFIDHSLQVTGIAFHPDGRRFATTSMDKTVKIWDLSPEIFADFYFHDEITSELNNHAELFEPRQKGEARQDFEVRNAKALEIRKEIYGKFYEKYRECLREKNLP